MIATGCRYAMSCSVTLKQKGFRLTPQRRLIVDVIHEARGHLTAEEIIDYVQSRVAGVNKSTIYRTLELLEELGCVYRSRLGDHFIYHHAKSEDLDDDLFAPVEQAVEEKYGFHVGFTHVVMRGLCAECRAKGQQDPGWGLGIESHSHD
jgi:Fur family ferric uptake transcriptional regulator